MRLRTPFRPPTLLAHHNTSILLASLAFSLIMYTPKILSAIYIGHTIIIIIVSSPFLLWGTNFSIIFALRERARLHFGGSICLEGPAIFAQHFCFCNLVVFCWVVPKFFSFKKSFKLKLQLWLQGFRYWRGWGESPQLAKNLHIPPTR